MSIKTKIINIDDKLRLSRTIEVSIGAKTIVTPKRVLAISKYKHYDESSLKNKDVKGFVEIYRRIDYKALHKIIGERIYESRFNYELSSLLKKAENDITIGFIEYDTGGRRPDKSEVEHLVHLFNNPLLDILALPIMPKMPCDEYIRFLDEFIDIYQSISFRAILVPIIPHYASPDIIKLFEFYVKKDQISKNFICVDFNGSNPISQYSFVSEVIRESQKFEKEYGAPCVRYGINVKYGKATKKQDVVPAKDIMIFAMGFNLFGANHKVIPIIGDIGKYELGTKAFNRNDYGYYSLEKARDFISENNEFEIKLSDIIKDARLTKIFNAERHGLEALEISIAINENDLSKYINSKRRIKENEKILKILSKVSKIASEGTLLKYF